MGFLIDVERGAKSMIVIQGDPGTGKTVVAIYLIKLLVDIQTFTSLEDLDSDSRFSDFFTKKKPGATPGSPHRPGRTTAIVARLYREGLPEDAWA